MAAKLNRSRPFDTVHGDNADNAITMQVQDGQVRYFGPDDTEVGSAAEVDTKPEPKRKAKPQAEPPPQEPAAAEEPADESAQLDLEQQLARNLV